MNSSQSYDSLLPRFPHHGDAETLRRNQKNPRKFISIDLHGHLSLTENRALRSSLKQIYRFVTDHSEWFFDQVDLLLSYINDLDKEHCSHHRLVRRIHSFDSFILNLGKTDDTLIKKIEYQVLTNEINHFKQNKEIMHLIDSIVRKKNKLKAAEENKSISRPALMREISTEIDNDNHDLFLLLQLLRSKQFRKQINALLKKIRISEDDAHHIQKVKRQIALEHKELIDVISFSQVQFHQKYRLKIFFEASDEALFCDDYINFSDKKRHNRKEWVKVETSENGDLSDPLIKNLKHIETCHRRDCELSVNKAFENFRKNNNDLLKKMYYQKIANHFFTQIEQDGLRDKIVEVATLQEKLDKEGVDHTEEQKKISKKGIKKKLNALRTKEFFNQVKSILKEIQVFETDTCSIRDAKNQLREENIYTVKILETLRKVKFGSKVEVILLDLSMEGTQQKLETLKFPINFTDRYSQKERDYFIRSPEDFSIHRRLEKFLEEHERDFSLKLSQKDPF